MGHDAASSCTSSDITAAFQRGIDRHAAFPACRESVSSDFSTFSSSASEAKNLARFACGASALFERSGGGDTSSAVSTRSSKKEPSLAHFDCIGMSSDPLYINSPFLEEGLAITTQELEESDGVCRDLDPAVKPCLEDIITSDGLFQVDACCDDNTLLSCLDKLFGSDVSQELVDGSGLNPINNSLPDMGCPLNELSSFLSIDSFPGLESSSVSNLEGALAMPSSYCGDEEESASQMFAQWWQNNSDWVSLSDLRKIKLKTSTVESGTKRLGGGRKGLLLFLNVVLMWLQNSRQKGLPQRATCMSTTLPLGVSPSPDFMGTTAMNMEGASSRDTFGVAQNSDVPDIKAQVQTPNFSCGSLQTTALSADWTTSSTQSVELMSAQPNYSNLISTGCTAATNGSSCSSLPCSYGSAWSPFPSINFDHSNREWFPHDINVMHRVCPFSLGSSLQPLSPANKNSFESVHKAGASSLTVSMQPQQCTYANPAATCRAARRSRMERQRWSVRRSRKCEALSQIQRVAAVASSNGYALTNIASSNPKSLANRVQKWPYLDSQSHKPTATSSSTIDHQQRTRQESNLKLLFQKEQKQSDVGALGRIVLPKVDSS